MKKTGAAIALCFVLLFSLVQIGPVAAAVDSYESDDSYTTATTISTDGTPQTHTIDPAGDVDYVKFTATAGAEYTIETTLGTCSDTYIYLYSTDGTTEITYNDDGGEGLASKIAWTCTSSGTYYVKIRHYWDDETGSYDIRVTSGAAGTDSYEPDGSPSTAATISTDGTPQTHTIDPAGDVDYVKFSAISGTEYTIETTLGTCSDTYIYLYDTDGTSVLRYDDDSGDGYASKITWTCTSSGTYYVKIRHYSSSGVGSYDISVSSEAVGPAADAYEPDGTATAAKTISTDGTAQTHTIYPAGDVDYVKFTATAGAEYTIETTLGTCSDTYIYLYGTDGTTVIDYDDDSGPGYASQIIWTCTSSGTYYVKIRHYSSSGVGSYDISVFAASSTTQNDMGTGADAGDSFSGASVLITPASGTGYVDSDDLDDYYKVSVVSGQTISATLTPPSGSDFDLYLYDTGQSHVSSSTYGGSSTDSVEVTATASGDYYIKVHHYSGSGTYSLVVSVTGVGAVQDDMGTGADAGNSPSVATMIDSGTGTGYIDDTDTSDYYKVNVDSGQTISVSMTPPSGSDFDIKLFNPAQSQVDSSTYGGSATDTVEGTATSITAGGWYIHVYHYSGEGIYSMTVTVTGGTAQNDMGTGGDAGNSLNTATMITTRTGTGYIDDIDTDDYYKVNVSSGQTINVSMTPPSGSDFDLKLYDTDQSYVDSSAYGGSQTDSVTYTATSSGYFYIHVYHYSGEGIYSLAVTVTGGATQNDMGTGIDAGNSLSAATTIPARTGTGYLDDTDSADYYKVSVSAGQTINVDLTPPSGSDFDLTLYNSSQSEVDSSAYGGSQTDSVTGTATSSGYFYIYVEQWSGSGIYSMTVTVTGGTTQNDMGTGTDAGNTLSAATAIRAGSGTGYINLTDTYDYYKVSVSSGQTVSVSMTPPSGSDFDLVLFDTDEDQVDSSTYGGSQTDSVESVAASSGYFYIKVYQYSGSGVYSLTITVTGGTAQNDWNSGQDAGADFNQALMISAGTGTGYVGETDIDDYYRVQVGSAGTTISVSLVPPSSSDFDLYLYSPSQAQVDYSILGGDQTDTVQYDAASAGVYYIRVHRYSGRGTYSLNVSVSGVGALAESAHPYANNSSLFWTINRPGAGRIRAHFTQLDVETNWDYVYIYDEDYNQIASYTGSYRDMWTDWVDGSTIIIGLSTDGSVTNYGFTVDQVETGAAVTVTPTNKVAVLVGINDYARINDLRYAVNDAQDWRSYLVGNGYTIGSFLTNSQATEASIRTAITNAAAQAGADGTLVLVFSGHGTNASPGDAHAYCCYDAGSTSNTGYLTGTELRDLLSGYNGKLFVFFDSCFSGGMSQSVTSTKRYMTTTCTGSGYGYDESSYSNGAWTYWYLQRGLVGQSFTTAEEAFSWASANYPYGGDDAPQGVDGDTATPFNLG